MELSIISNNMQGGEIKPSSQIETYKNKVKADVDTFLRPTLQESACPVCGSKQSTRNFSKFEIPFSVCADCLSIYASKRPTQEALNQFYTQGQARKFWQEDIWQATKVTRLEKISIPLVKWIDVHMQEYLPDANVPLAEVYASNMGLREAYGQTSKREVLYIEPLMEMSNAKKIDAVFDTFAAIGLFDALDRVNNPLATLDWVREHLQPGGLLFLTNVFATGFDILVLGESSDAILPPDRLNLFSFEELQKVLANKGFEAIEVSTPGVLDVQNLRSSKAKLPAVIEYIVHNRGSDALLKNLQNFIQTNALSSQGRLVLRKK